MMMIKYLLYVSFPAINKFTVERAAYKPFDVQENTIHTSLYSIHTSVRQEAEGRRQEGTAG
jgi:hypothetical protein